jgi:hypothetical protein
MHPALRQTLQFSAIFFVLILIYEMLSSTDVPVMQRVIRAALTTLVIGGIYGLFIRILHGRKSRGDKK